MIKIDNGNICTHDKNSIGNTISINNLELIEKVYVNKLSQADIILIDELQFFENSMIFIKKLVENYGKIVMRLG